jgi:hypothetical protein
MAPPPWHLWGQNAPVAVNLTRKIETSQQLVRVNYKRPESWRFLAYAQIINIHGPYAQAGSLGDPPVTDIALFVAFEFALGVGLGKTTLRGAPTGIPAVFDLKPGLINFKIPIGSAIGAMAFSTSANAQNQVAGDMATAITPLMDQFPASEIQVSATVAALMVHDYTIDLNVGCLVAPISHTRPEWHMGQFSGDEHTGK